MAASETGPSQAVFRSQTADGIPLTDRILARLPGADWIWILLWALLVAIRPAIYAQLLRAAGHTGVTLEFVRARLPSHAVYAYMVLLAFWAVRKFAAEARALEPALQQLAPHAAGSRGVFRGLASGSGPLALTVLVTLVLSIEVMLAWGPAVAAIFLPYMAVPILPLMTLFWVYNAVLLGLDRLGRRPMDLGPFPEDPSLGVAPIGGLAFTAFLIFCAATVPFLLVRLRDPLDLTVGLTFFIAGVGAFFLSMWRLHRQMVETKARHLAWVRRLYGEAFAPIRPQPTLEGLQARGPLVGAAEALEKRAAAIQEWPFDDRTMTRIVAISTGVVTAVLARFVLRAIGL